MGYGVDNFGAQGSGRAAGYEAEVVERWLPIPWARKYEVSSLGRVRRIGEPECLAGATTRGYRRVSIRGVTTQVHRLVLEVFVGRCPAGYECAHYDGDPANNRLDNLRWATSKENAADTRRLGRFPIGSKQGRAKLDEDLVVELRRRYRVGWKSYADLAAEIGVSPTVVQFAVTGRTWKHVDGAVDVGTIGDLNAVRGTRHHLAKLTEGDVVEMRGLYATGDYYKRDLAKMFGVHYNTCIQALSGFTWKHV